GLRRRGGLLAHAVLGGHVGTQPTKARLTQRSRRRPFAVSHLADQLGPDPGHPLVGGGHRMQWALRGGDGVELLAQPAQGGLVKPRADLSGMTEHTVLIEDAEYQRSQRPAALAT